MKWRAPKERLQPWQETRLLDASHRHVLTRAGNMQTGFALAKQLYKSRLAPDFSPFQFIRTNENRLSEIIAWLLDPRGSHGQGGRFLGLLLAALDVRWPTDGISAATVDLNRLVEGRQPDLTISIPNRHLSCVIENKAWGAKDQPDQIRDYFCWLDGRHNASGGASARNFPLIYLTRDGTFPESLPEEDRKKRIADRQLHLWSCGGRLFEWVEQCRAVCEADRVSIFLDEFARFIRGHFGGARDVNMEDHLIAEILKSPGDVKAAMQIAFGRKQLESTLLKKLVAELAGASDGETWRVDASEANNGLLARQWKGISVHFSDQLDCHFRLQFDESGYSSAIYGVAKKDEFSKVHETREARLAEYGPGILSDASWYWYRKLNVNDDKMPFEADWNSNAEPWSEIASGTFADKLISVAKDLRVVLLSTL